MPRKKKTFTLPKPPKQVPEISKVISDYMDNHPKSFPPDKRLSVQYFKDNESVSFQLYPGAFLSSEDFSDIMTHLERSCYFLLLLHAFEQPIRCFMTYDLYRLTIRCKITPRRFLKVWERILSTKFQFATHEGVLYIFNYRLFAEFMRSASYKQRSRKGGEETQRKRKEEKMHDARFKQHEKKESNNLKQSQTTSNLKPEPSNLKPLTFASSPFFNKNNFIAEIKKQHPDFADVNLVHYHKRLEIWSKKGNKSPDWINMAATFIINDATNGKTKMNKSVSADQKHKIEKGLSKIQKSKHDVHSREEEIRAGYAEAAQ